MNRRAFHIALSVSLSVSLSVWIVLVAAGSSQGALVIHYTFDNEAAGDMSYGAPVGNEGETAVPGQVAFSAAGGIEIVDEPSPAGGNHLRVAFGGSAARDPAPHIDTSISFVDLGLTHSSEWTMMAWIRFAPFSFDNFAFSQAGLDPGYLHYGGRVHAGVPRYYSGHWTDDWYSESERVEPGVWHHVAWTNDSAGNQMIYLDGDRIDVIPALQGGVPFDLNRDITIGGPRGFNRFEGGIDDVRIYDELLDASTIATLSRPIPEPSSLLSLGILGAWLSIRRRKGW